MADPRTSPTHIKTLPVIVTLALTAFQLVRIIAFVNVYGGVEHDGGWMLGISRSLAEQGTYSTMFNTIENPLPRGDVDINGTFSYQGPDGRMWFVSSGVGFASIVPDAFVLKAFGFDFWALRAGPLIFYTLFLLLVAYILYQLAGMWAIFLFHAFLFFYPHLSIFLGYEAMGEVPALFYVSWAFLAFASATHNKKHRWLRFLGVGLVMGLAVNTKMLALLSVSGILIWNVYLWLFSFGQESPQIDRQIRFKDLLSLGIGILFVQVFWLLVETLSLVRFAGWSMYRQHARDFLVSVLDNGSGLRTRLHSGPEFVWRKMLVMQETFHPRAWVTLLVFACLLLGGLWLLWMWHQRGCTRKLNLAAPIWFGWLANCVWFFGVAMAIAPRHFYFGLMLGVMLASVVPVVLIKESLQQIVKPAASTDAVPLDYRAGLNWKYVRMAMGGALAVLLLWGFVCQPHVLGVLLPDEIVSYWRDKANSHVYDAAVPWIIIPRSDQAEVVEYIKRMPPEARVYYPAGHKAAEIPPQTGRVHYPLARRSSPSVSVHPEDVLIVGVSVLSRWTDDPIIRHEIVSLVERSCPNPVLKNENYLLCQVEEVRLP